MSRSDRRGESKIFSELITQYDKQIRTLRHFLSGAAVSAVDAGGGRFVQLVIVVGFLESNCSAAPTEELPASAPLSAIACASA